ncbi:MAG: hypothetical protein LRS43_03635 [Desulfurococcales archaeon]|nr:hypothetical protein [Desulfurococcales archaeon]
MAGGFAYSGFMELVLPSWFAQGLLLLGFIILALIAVIVLYVIYRVLSRSNVEVSLSIHEHPGQLSGDSIESVRRSLMERGVRAEVVDGRIRVGLVGFYVEARGVSTPVSSVVYKVGAQPLGIIIALVLLILYPVGWLILVLILAVLYVRYSELRKIVELELSRRQGQG